MAFVLRRPGHVERMRQRRVPGRGVYANPTVEARTQSTGVGTTSRWILSGHCRVYRDQADLHVRALNATMRICCLILHLLRRQKRDSSGAKREEDESGWQHGVGRLAGERLEVERPFKRLLQNQFS